MNFEWLQKNSVTRAFIVKRKFVPLMPDFHDPAKARRPTAGGSTALGRVSGQLPIGRPERVAREDMLDVGEQQLLVLLLVVDSQFDDLCDVLCVSIAEAGQQTQHALINGMPIFEHLRHGRPRQ